MGVRKHATENTGEPGGPRPPGWGSGPLWLHPDDDLAPNRPGEILHGRVAALPAGRLRALAGRLLPGAGEAGALRSLLAGEERVGRRLDGYAGAGWRVLHSVPLPGGACLSHLAVGPGGVFALRTVHHPGARPVVDEDWLRVPGRPPSPDVRACRRVARRAAHALGRGCGFPVPVRPVLVCAGATGVTREPAALDVDVLTEDGLDALAGRGGVLKPDAVERIHGVARDRRVWLHA